MPRGIRQKARRIDDGELRDVRVLGRSVADDEQVAGEQAVPRELVDDTDGHPVFRIGAGVTVLNVDFLACERCEQIAMQRVEMHGLHRPVHLAPCDLSFARRLADHELVVRRSPGVLAREADERAAGGDQPFLAADGFFVQGGGRQVPMHPIGADALALEAASSGKLGTSRACRATRTLNVGAHSRLRKV